MKGVGRLLHGFSLSPRVFDPDANLDFVGDIDGDIPAMGVAIDRSGRDLGIHCRILQDSLRVHSHPRRLGNATAPRSVPRQGRPHTITSRNRQLLRLRTGDADDQRCSPIELFWNRVMSRWPALCPSCHYLIPILSNFK